MWSRAAVLAFVAVSASGCGDPKAAPAPEPKTAAAQPSAEEVRKSARPIAYDFLAAARGGDYAVAAGLISPGYEAPLRARNPQNQLPALLGCEFEVGPLRPYGNSLQWFQKAKSHEITAESVAPDHQELAFDGRFAMADAQDVRFRVRVGADKASGRWRVESIVFRDRMGE